MQKPKARRRDSLVESVSRKLSEKIRSGGAQKHEWLPAERALSEKLGVSRTVLREAVKRLELQGLVEVKHGVGIRVIDQLHKPLIGSLALLMPDSRVMLRQLMEARLMIETEVARLAARRASSSHLDQLREAQEQITAATDDETAVHWDLEFHRALARASGNEIFGLILDSFAELGIESRQLTIARSGRKLAAAHHQEILEAVESHNEAKAVSAMRKHLEAAGKDLEQQLMGKGIIGRGLGK